MVRKKRGREGESKRIKKSFLFLLLCVTSENIKHKARIVRGEGEREKTVRNDRTKAHEERKQSETTGQKPARDESSPKRPDNKPEGREQSETTGHKPTKGESSPK